jgi:hypothetical protein
MSKEVLRDVRNGKPYTYYIDTADQVHFIEGRHIIDRPGDFLILKNPGTEEALIIKESGTFNYLQNEKNYKFSPKKSWAISEAESASLIDDLEKANPELKFTRETNLELGKSRVFSCTEALSAQKKGRSFIWNSLVSSNVVSIAGMVTQELSGNHLLTDPNKRNLVYADLISNNITTLITSPLVKQAIVSNASISKDFLIRTGSDYLTNAFIKKPLYDVMTPKKDEEKESLGQKLVPYDTGFGILRFFPKRALDQFMVNKLPDLMLKSCLKGDAWVATVGPKMIRIADRYSWGLIYLSGREKYLELNP